MPERIALWTHEDMEAELSKLLVDQAVEPVLVRSDYDFNREPYFRIVNCETRQNCVTPPSMEKALIYLPLIPGIVELTRAFIQAADEWGIRHIVRVSDYNIDGPLGNVRMQIHGVLDTLLVRSGISYTILRFNCYPSHDDFLDQALNLPLSDGFGKYEDAGGIARLAVNALKDPESVDRVYDMVGPKFSHESFPVLSEAESVIIQSV